MAYYTGQAASYAELLNVFTGYCVVEGWIWTKNVLSKNNIYVGLSASNIGIVATGYTALTKTNPSAIKPRIGAASSTISLPTFPIDYHIFIFESEIYLITNFSIDFYHYLAVGDTNPYILDGFWISASSCELQISTDSRGGYSFDLNASNPGNNIYQCPTPFGKLNYLSADWVYNSVILHKLDGGRWSGISKQAFSTLGISPLLSIQPSGWSSDSILIPIPVFIDRASSKKSQVAEFINSRFTRIDNFEPKQILTFGNDKWMVFPLYKKNIGSRDGGSVIDHSGTFGWAIRYDGP